ncbi:chemotaxis motB protein [Burkholderia pseudomallei]|nr:chemotaxis motB protein [Burkholderia pseudomallei]
MSVVDDVAARAQHTLDAWRERGADRLAPVRFRFIDALRRRAAAHGGDARRLLDARLAALIDAYAADLRRAESNGDACECAGAPVPVPVPVPVPAPAPAPAPASSTSPAPTPAAPSTTTTSPAASSPADPARGPLAALLDYIGSRERPTASAPDETRAAPASSTASGRVALRAEPALLDYFRETWSKLSADSQLRASLEQVPKNAGPLNSSSLVHRSLSLMRELSPEYLRQFLSYVDALSWLQQMNGDEAATGDEAARGAVGGGGGASAKKNTRKRSR